MLIIIYIINIIFFIVQKKSNAQNIAYKKGVSFLHEFFLFSSVFSGSYFWTRIQEITGAFFQGR